MKDGNKEKISGEAGIGMLSSRLVLEGPIVKDKASFLVSGRRTYYDILARPFIKAYSEEDIKLSLYFYDLTAKANWEIDNKNRIFLSGYFGEDKFAGGEEYDGAKYEGGMFWNNATSTLRWNHIFTSRLFSNLSVIFSNYRLNIYARDEYDGDVFELSYRSGIRDFGTKYDFTWMPSPSHTIRFGMTSTWHSFNPSAVVIRDDYLNEFENIVNTIDTYESGLYLEDEVKILDKGIVNAGVRLSHHYHDGASNFSFEPRISGSYYLTNTLSAKASYAQMNQYIHLLTSTGIGLPTDLWVPATKDAPAQDSWQVAAGFAKDLKDISTTISLEGYYKESENVITYREGASFLMFDDPTNANNIKWEDNITSGFGWSYGVEFLAHKKMGRFSGWVGYTLSWTQLQFDEINMGKPYWARYDRRHDISVVGVYEFSPGITLSGTWVYGTGNAVTLPLATYPVNQHVPNSVSNYVWTETIQDYGKKNDFRMAPYHRLDVSVQIHKKFEKYERTWEFGAYNAYNRQNPFMYFVRGEHKHNPRTGESTYVNKLKQISLFQFIPSVSWSIKF